MIVKATHKRLDLAVRHAEVLARQNKADVRIISRRNDSGRFSSRGTRYTFEVLPSEPPEKKKEITTLREFMEEIDHGDEFDNYDVDGGVDYGEEE